MNGGTVEALSALVSAIGTPSFSGRLFAVLRVLAGVELFSAFIVEKSKAITFLFASGEPLRTPDFTLSASRAYERDFWRFDRQLPWLARAPVGTLRVVSRRAADIRNPAYRGACYDRANVIERVSILSAGSPALMVNGYRTNRTAPFASSDIETLQYYAALLLAALRQHLRIGSSSVPASDRISLIERLGALEHGLSLREAEVVANIMLGETQKHIARVMGLSPTTVITYRRRAYGKLGVSNRHDLKELHRQLQADGDQLIIDKHGSRGWL